MKNNRRQGIHNIIRILLAMAIIAALASCVDKPVPPSPVVSDMRSTYLGEDWVHKLRQWLSLSYVEDGNEAGFSLYPTSYLKQPDLYTSYWTLNILDDLNAIPDIPSRKNIIDWIRSTKDEKGFYTDLSPELGLPIPPRENIPTIQETQQAVQMLRFLGEEPLEKQSTIDFLLSLQRPDGLFDFSFEPATLSERIDERFEKRIDAFLIVTIILRELDFDNWDELNPSVTAVKTYLDTEMNQGNSYPGLLDSKTGTLITAIRSLAEIDPHLVPERTGQFMMQGIEEASQLDGSLMSVWRVSDLIETAKVLKYNEVESASALSLLRNYLITMIFPQQKDDGLFDDLLLTSKVANLAKMVGEPFPNQERIKDLLSKHRIDDGWVKHISLNLQGKAQNTFFALELAQEFGFNEYDSELVSNYLRQVILRDGRSLRELYYALLSYRLIRSDIEQNTVRNLELRSVDFASKLQDAIQDSSEWAYFALLSTEIGFSIPDDAVDKMSVVENGLISLIQLGQDLEWATLYLYYLSVMQETLYGSISFDGIAAKELILSSLSESGGFKASSSENSPDIIATSLALKVLAKIGAQEDVDKERLVSFVLSSKRSYGFEMRNNPERPMPTADFGSTYEAVRILEQYGQY